MHRDFILTGIFSKDAAQSKRKRLSNAKVCEIESEPEEHSLSLSQHSSPSPSQSDQEQTPVKKGAHSITTSQVFPLFKQKNQISSNGHSNDVKSTKLSPRDFLRKDPRDFHILRGNPNPPNSDQHLHAAHTGRNEAHHPANEQRFLEAGPFQNLVIFKYWHRSLVYVILTYCSRCLSLDVLCPCC